MNPEAANLLSQLRDIHGAPEAPWWPPAPGWWLLFFLLVACLAWGLGRLLRLLKQRRRRQRLLAHLQGLREDMDPATRPQDYLAALNQLLKLVALQAFPDQHCASMQGKEWRDFLRGKLPAADASAIDVSTIDALAAGPYQPAPVFDADGMERLAREWIRRHA